MKNILTFCFICFLTTGFAQGLTDSYINSGVAYGVRPVSPQLSDVNFTINNNGVVEYFSSTLPDEPSGNGLNIFVGFGRYKGLSHQLFFDLPIGDFKNSKFGYNIGYSMAFEVGRQDLLLRPSVGVAIGDGTYELGQENYSVSTPLVFDTLNLAEPVTFALRRNVVTINPGIELTYLINQKYALVVQGHYDLDISNRTQRVTLDADSIDGSRPAYEFSDLITVNHMGSPLSSKLLDYSGLRFSIGISSYINKQLFN